MNRQQQLLKKYLDRQCTPAERMELYHHLQAESDDAYEAVIAQLWSELYDGEEHSLSSAESQEMYDRVKTRFPRRRAPWRAAAVLVGVLLGSIAVYYGWISRPVVFTAPYGQTATVILPDQSTVVLNANSEIRYTPSWSNSTPREVSLVGEAYFSVQHTQYDQPFTVHTNNLAVEVLGTEFNVRHRRGDTQVTLSAGKVKLNDLSTTSEVTDVFMYPGEQATLTAERQFTLDTVSVASVIAWQEHQLVYDNVPLSSVARDVEDLYGQSVTLATDSIRSLTLTGTLPNNDLAMLLKLLEETFDVKVRKTAHTIILEH